MKTHYCSRFIVSVFILLTTISFAIAATSPNLATSVSFSILSSTYTNTTGGTILNGDLGYTTGPATVPTINGTTHAMDSAYNQAGINQGSALTALNSQPCSFTFAAGAVDLASDSTHGTIGIYTPGIYCITGAASIGGGGTITLNGSGSYIFRMTGALNTSANSIVTLSGASACNVWWTPNAATTLGANSAFMGTVVDPSGITIGSTVIWAGRALAYGGTVSTTSDTITVPTCLSTIPPTTTAIATAVTTATTTPLATKVTPTQTTSRLANTGNNNILNIAVGSFLLSMIILIYSKRKKVQK